MGVYAEMEEMCQKHLTAAQVRETARLKASLNGFKDEAMGIWVSGKTHA